MNPITNERITNILNSLGRCPKYMESICDILDYLVWLRLHGYKKGYGEDSMDEDENGIPPFTFHPVGFLSK